MSTSFLHGVEVLEIDTGLRPIKTVRSGVIGLVGTAADADASVFPLDTPVLIAGDRTKAGKLGTTGTLPAALDGIFDSAGAVVVVIRVDHTGTDAQVLSNVIGSSTGYTGCHGLLAAKMEVGFDPKILIAPGFTSSQVTDGVTSIAVTNGGSGYTSAPTVSFTGGGGSSAAATANTGTLKNPVVAELEGIADQLAAVIIADGPNTTDAAAQAYAALHYNPRIYVIDPHVRVYDTASSTYVNLPASSRVAGLIAKTDEEKGFWWSPSNQTLSGISGVARTVPFQLGSSTSAANLLNENKVGVIIRQDGYRLWGNRSTSNDSKWAFLSVRRTADMINQSILEAHLWAVDRCINRTYLQDVKEGVDAYLRSLIAKGAILGGKCWVDPEQNTPADIAAGKVTFDFDFTPCYPAERVTFRSQLTNGYITSALFD